MSTRSEIVVTLDGEVVSAEHPVGFVDDPMFARGDGVFEPFWSEKGGHACSTRI